MRRTMKVVLFALVIVVLRMNVTESAVTDEFTFRQQDCAQSKYGNYGVPGSLGALRTNKTGYECLPSNGLRSGMYAASLNDISILQSHLKASDFSIEFWIQPSQYLTINADIISLGSDSPSQWQCSNTAVVSQRPTSGNLTSFQISLCNQDRVTTGDILKSHDFEMEIIDGEAKLVHVLVGIQYSSLSVSFGGLIHQIATNFTINGVNKQDESVSYYHSSAGGFDPINWPGSSKLHMYPKHGVSSTTGEYDITAGNVYYVAIHNETLTAEQVKTRFQLPLANSPPFVRNKTLTVLENGQVGDHSTDPWFYLQPIPTRDLEKIQFDAYDLDYQPISPNHDKNTGMSTAEPSMQIVLTQLPRGSLYFLNGTKVVPTALPMVVPYNATLNLYALHYRPPLDQYSVRDKYSASQTEFTSLQYYAVDGVTNEASIEVATVSIVVVHVNKPPIVPYNSTVSTSAYTITTVSLPGSDPDSMLAAACIVSLPKSGVLYPVHRNGTLFATPLVLPQPSSSSSAAAGVEICMEQDFSTRNAIVIAYIYRGNETITTSGESVVGQDTFQYILRDEEGITSIPSLYSITANSALVAVPGETDDDKLAVEGLPSNITIYGRDDSYLSRALAVEILSLPGQGSLFLCYNGCTNTGNLTAIKIGGLVLPDLIQSDNPQIAPLVGAAEYSSGLKVVYRSNENYFTTPRITWNGTLLAPLDGEDSFTFRVITAESNPAETAGGDSQTNATNSGKSDGYTELSSTHVANSPAATQLIEVKNVNDPTYITFTYQDQWAATQSITIHAVSNTDADGDQYPSVAVLRGFSIHDVDRDVDAIKVRITAQYGGMLSLNTQPHVMDHVDFNSNAYCFGPTDWYCEGDGTSESHMVFVAPPSAVHAAINGLTYTSRLPFITDNITITLYDGEGGECLSQSQLGSGSIRSGCFVETISVPVTVLGFAGIEAHNAFASGSNSALVDRLQYIALGLLLCVVCVLIRCCCRSTPQKDQYRNPHQGRREGDRQNHHNEDENADKIKRSICCCCRDESDERQGWMWRWLCCILHCCRGAYCCNYSDCCCCFITPGSTSPPRSTSPKNQQAGPIDRSSCNARDEEEGGGGGGGGGGRSRNIATRSGRRSRSRADEDAISGNEEECQTLTGDVIDETFVVYDAVDAGKAIKHKSNEGGRSSSPPKTPLSHHHLLGDPTRPRSVQKAGSNITIITYTEPGDPFDEADNGKEGGNINNRSSSSRKQPSRSIIISGLSSADGKNKKKKHPTSTHIRVPLTPAEQQYHQQHQQAQEQAHDRNGMQEKGEKHPPKPIRHLSKEQRHLAAGQRQKKTGAKKKARNSHSSPTRLDAQDIGTHQETLVRNQQEQQTPPPAHAVARNKGAMRANDNNAWGIPAGSSSSPCSSTACTAQQASTPISQWWWQMDAATHDTKDGSNNNTRRDRSTTNTASKYHHRMHAATNGNEISTAANANSHAHSSSAVPSVPTPTSIRTMHLTSTSNTQ